MLRSGLITSYRGERYHLKEYSTHAPQNKQELFNHRHVSLHNVIERSFGVLKKRFPIIYGATEPHYDVATVTEIVIVCCILHNYLMGVDPNEKLINKVDCDLLSQTREIEETYNRHNDDEDVRQGVAIRNNIAKRMWQDYDDHRE